MITDNVKKPGIELVIRTSSKYLGRVGRWFGIIGTAVGGIVTTYSIGKEYVKLIKSDPDAKKIAELSIEHRKWGSAVSCLGREPYCEGYICSIERGGAINALGEKLSVIALSTRYTRDISDKIRNPEPAKAKELIQNAIDSVVSTKDNLGVEDFNGNKKEIIKCLKDIDNKLEPEYNPEIDYTPFQQELSNIVRKMVKIEFEYNLEISRLVNIFHKKIPVYAAKAGWDGTVGELIKVTKGIIKQITKVMKNS